MLSEWLKLENLKWLITTAAIPVTLAYVSHQYERAQNERQAAETRAQNERQSSEARLRLYTELLSKREEADTGVRKGIFDKVLEKYLKPEAKELGEKLVALELLALNFNDSLDLSPLFWQLDREIQQLAEGIKRTALIEQLERIATQVKDRQIELLEFVGHSQNAKVELRGKEASLDRRIDQNFSFPDPDVNAPKGQKLTRHFAVEVAEHDFERRRVLVYLTHRGVNDRERLSAFWVDVFDFPLTNFTRISKSERFAVLLKRYRPPTADLTLIYFPSSRSGVKDKPFIDEVISDLRREGK